MLFHVHANIKYVIGMKNNDDLDLTGQEDPVFLHVALKTLPIHIAYKEGTVCFLCICNHNLMFSV